MRLTEIIGNSRAKTLLNIALTEKRVVHAYLFYGPAGIGKTTFARALAAALLCGKGGTDACGQCSVCRRVDEGKFPDFFVVEPVGNSIKIEQVRNLQRKAQFKPYEAKLKVYLIDQAEHMTNEAANCLLKILEDPPIDTIFLLTAVNLYNLLPTIISRCQLISMTRASRDEINNLLLDIMVDKDAAALIAALADGLPGKARKMAESGKALEIRQEVFNLVEKLAVGNVNEILILAEEMEKKKEVLPDILDQLLIWFRDQLIWLQTGNDRLLVNIDCTDRLKSLTPKTDKEYITGGISDILQARRQIKQNVNLRLTLEVLFLRLAQTA
jgi:DNA polymerase-3 subunit delta'